MQTSLVLLCSTRFWAVLVTMSLLGLWGCDERDPNSMALPSVAQAPVALERTLAYVQQDPPTVRLLDVGGDNLAAETRAVQLPSGLNMYERRNGADELLALCAGDSEQELEPALLAINGEGKQRTYPLNSSFNSIQQSADGRWALLLTAGGNLGRQFIANPNQVALVDLGAPAGDANPIHHTLLGLSGAPAQAVFSPELELHGKKRRLLVLLADTYLSLFDLSDPRRREITVPLGGTEVAAGVRPVQVLFSDDGERLFVRGEASSEIFVITLNPDADGESEHDFVATSNQLSAGGDVLDMQLYVESDGAPRVLALTTRKLAVVDPRSARLTQIPLAGYGSKLLAYTAASPTESSAEPRVLVYDDAGYDARLSFVDLDHLEQRKGRNVQGLALNHTTRSATPLLEQGLVVLFHQPETSDWGEIDENLSILDLAERTVAPIVVSGLTWSRFDLDAQLLWVGASDYSVVGYLQLPGFEPGEVRVDAPIRHFELFPAVGRAVIDHGYDDGYVTVLESGQPQRSSARSVKGFLWSRVLD